MTTETVRAVNVGTTADDGTGARLRDAAEIWNSNDALLAQLVGGILAGIDPDRNSLKKLADLIAGLSLSLGSLSIGGVQGLTAALAGKATPADITAAINAIIGGAGPAYDTFRELQDLLVADETAAAALAALVATKAPLASPTFSGVPSAPTATVGDNSTRLATTAFVTAALVAFASGGVSYATLDDVRSLAIQLAKVKGSTVGMAGGVADDFRDQTGIDTANSVNASYDVGGNTVGNYLAATDDLAPMTSNSAPSGQTAAASDETYGQAYKVYDGGATTVWSIQAQSGTLSRTSAAARTEAAYAVTYYDGTGSLQRAPKTWTRWGSNDGGSTKVTLDTQTSQTGWAQGERRTFVIPVGSRAAFKTYGFTFTANNGESFSTVASIESLLAGSGAMDLRSVAFPAQAVPTKGSLFVLVKAATDSIVANGNLLAKLSRDGGTTYTTATLTSTGTLSSGYAVFEANGFDLTAQPSGSSMKWRLQTVGTSLTVVVDAVVAQWG